MWESHPEARFSLIYFSWKYSNICYTRGRNKERGIAQVRTSRDLLQGLSTFTGEVQLLVGVCWEMTPVESRLMFSNFPAGLPDPHPEERGFEGLAGEEILGHWTCWQHVSVSSGRWKEGGGFEEWNLSKCTPTLQSIQGFKSLCGYWPI